MDGSTTRRRSRQVALRLEAGCRARQGDVAAVAITVPVCAFLLTDFEGGLIDVFSIRQHLRFDVAEGFLLFGAGMAMRRQPAGSRVILAIYGLSQFVLGLSISETTKSRPSQGPGPIARLLGSA